MRWQLPLLALAMASLASPPLGLAADPTVDDALRFRPIQKNVEYDSPEAADIAKCSLKPEKSAEESGWVVRDPQGQILRRFIDTNADNTVDMWCYFQDGLEVYRDIDSNHNNKADQCRWLNLGGTRWGLDDNEDGTIDSWKLISAEEASAELVAALAARDATAFKRLLLTADELQALGLGEERQKQLAERIAAAPAEFDKLSATQKIVTPASRWASFGAIRPGLVPARTQGSTEDLVVYENVVAMIDTDKTPGQVQIGTLIQLGGVWKVIDAPRPLEADDQGVGAYVFFDPGTTVRNDVAETAEGGPSAEVQKLLHELEQLDKAGANDGAFDERRAELLRQLADKAEKPEDRAGWIRQLADMTSAAAQTGTYPDGVAQLQTLFDDVSADGDKDLAGYVKFRLLTAQYTASLQAENPDFEKIQKEWLANLEQFVADYPKGADAAEALLQLAIAQEFAGQDDEAKKWYRQIVDSHPDSAPAKKASGAIARIDSVGKVIRLTATSTANQPIDLARLRGRVVLLHYWATWSDPCKADLAIIKDLFNRYKAKGFEPIGICLDNTPETVKAYLAENPLNWPQIYEPGGLDSRLANELGILTMPTMLLIDTEGRVANRSVHVNGLEAELKALLPATAPPPRNVAAPSDIQPARPRPGARPTPPRQAERRPGGR